MDLSSRPKLAGLSVYRPEIDGLRAVAILPVVFYHAGIAPFSGGFVGVDIFFVISGYLITSILLREIATDRFSIAAFYERRMRRIFPALFAMAGFCVATGALLLAFDDFRELGQSLTAMTFFVSNIFFERTADAKGYFDVASDSQVLLHTWSLAVEEQFYVFFPVALLLVTRRAKDWLKPCLLAAFCMSLLLSIYLVQRQPTQAFYLLPPRAWELLTGALLAVKILPPLTRRDLREATGLIGLALIAFAIFVYDRDTPFPGLAALPPCLGAGLIIHATETGDCTTKKLLSLRPMVLIGLISYSLYLWHWPLIVFTRYFLFVDHLSVARAVMVIAASVATASLSYKFVESPFRRAKGPGSRIRVIRNGLMASLVCAIAGFAIIKTDGFPQRFNDATLQLLAANIDRKTDHINMKSCDHWRRKVDTVADLRLCPMGDAGATRKILFWGDSHVGQLRYAIRRLYDEGRLGGRSVIFTVASACPPALDMNMSWPGFYCDRFSQIALQRAEETDVDIVYIGFSTSFTLRDGMLCAAQDGRCTKLLSQREAKARFIAELVQNIRTLRDDGKTVVVGLPFPIYNHPIPELEIHAAMLSHFASMFTPKEMDDQTFRRQLETAATNAGAVLFDPRLALCNGANCLYQRGGISIYSDNNHIAASQTGLLDDDLGAALSQAISFSATAARHTKEQWSER